MASIGNALDNAVGIAPGTAEIKKNVKTEMKYGAGWTVALVAMTGIGFVAGGPVGAIIGYVVSVLLMGSHGTYRGGKKFVNWAR